MEALALRGDEWQGGWLSLSAEGSDTDGPKVGDGLAPRVYWKKGLSGLKVMGNGAEQVAGASGAVLYRL